MNRRITFVALLLALVLVGRFTFTPARSHGQSVVSLTQLSPHTSPDVEEPAVGDGSVLLFGVSEFLSADAAFNLENDGLARHRRRIQFASTRLNIGELGIEVPRFHFPVDHGQLLIKQETLPDLRWIAAISPQQQFQSRPSVVHWTAMVPPLASPVSRLPEWNRLAHADVPVDPSSPPPFNQPYVPSYPVGDLVPSPALPAPPGGTPPTGAPPVGSPVDPPINLPNEFVGPVRVPTEPAVPEPGGTLAGMMILCWMLRRTRH